MTLPDWHFTSLEDLIQSRGDEVILETGVACTCRREDATAGLLSRENAPATLREIHCQRCTGEGFLYRNARVIKGLVTSIQSAPNRRLLEGGYGTVGDAVFSPSIIEAPLGDSDKITFLHASLVNDGQVIMRNAANYGDNKSKPLGVTNAEDRLWYNAECAIWCEDQKGVVYEQGTDFLLVDHTIKWIGNTPRDGLFYTLKYRAYLEWIVYNTPLFRIDGGNQLGQKVLIRKKHVAYHSGNIALDTPAKRQEDQENFTIRTRF
jgi:hypothetical protein